MKQFLKIYTLLVTTMVGATACVPNMDLNNPEEVSTETYYTKIEQLEAAIIPAYQALFGVSQGGYAVGAFNNQLAPGDDFDATPSNTIFQDTYTTPAYDATILNSWKDFFSGVYAANLAIEKIENYTGDIQESIRDRMLGEAYFLRGLHYMHLCMLFGETVPLYDHSVTDASDYYKGNAQRGEIYAFIIDNFSKAAELLPVRSKLYENESYIGRATKGAAQGYLARAYLYRPLLEKGSTAEFSKAEKVLKEIIDSNEYELVDNFRDNSVGNNENNKESIFEVQMLLGADFFEQSYSLRWQMIGVPSGTGSAWWQLAPNQRTYNEFEEGDPRKFMTLWCPEGAYYTELNGNVADWEYMYGHYPVEVSLYGTRKYCLDYQIGNIANEHNERLMRYADILLMYAECLHEAGHDNLAITDPNGPKYWIQVVRSRANNIVPSEQPHLWYQHSPGTIPDVETLLASGSVINGVPMNNVKNLIVHERYVEFCGEYLRYFDLLRWGMADEKWLESIKDLGWTEKAMYYPFPQQELNNNKNLLGNEMNK